MASNGRGQTLANFVGVPAAPLTPTVRPAGVVTGGGTLLLGVEDKSRHIRGVRDALDLEERVANLISDWIAPLRITIFDDRLEVENPGLLAPHSDDTVYDPTVGSGGMLVHVADVHQDALNLTDVQELEAGDAELAPRVLALDDLLVVEGHAGRMQIGRCARVTEKAAGMTFQNELEFSRENSARYFLYRIFKFRADPRMFALHGHLQDRCILKPSQFLARPA